MIRKWHAWWALVSMFTVAGLTIRFSIAACSETSKSELADWSAKRQQVARSHTFIWNVAGMLHIPKEAVWGNMISTLLIAQKILEQKISSASEQVNWWKYNISMINPPQMDLFASGISENYIITNSPHIVHIAAYRERLASYEATDKIAETFEVYFQNELVVHLRNQGSVVADIALHPAGTVSMGDPFETFIGPAFLVFLAGVPPLCMFAGSEKDWQLVATTPDEWVYERKTPDNWELELHVSRIHKGAPKSLLMRRTGAQFYWNVLQFTQIDGQWFPLEIEMIYEYYDLTTPATREDIEKILENYIVKDDNGREQAIVSLPLHRCSRPSMSRRRYMLVSAKPASTACFTLPQGTFVRDWRLSGGNLWHKGNGIVVEYTWEGFLPDLETLNQKAHAK